ncbi:MAG: response regulator [Anaerolineae bacterium]|nr:response regulator [Anaerolineae bacterium]
MFQPFEQAGEAERRAGGTGLGLAISRQLVRLMGGEFQLKSPVSPAEPMTQGGPGSIFWFEIVVPVPEVEVAPHAPAQSIIGYSGPRRKVLVVDDVAANRMVVLELLTGLGFAVFEAANGQEGLEQAQALRPDIILMDRVMPGLDGLAATRRIREIPFLRETPIISISASVLETDREQCLAAGANAFVSKPIHQEELLAQLGRQLQLTWLYEQPPLEPVEALQVDLPPKKWSCSITWPGGGVSRKFGHGWMSWNNAAPNIKPLSLNYAG